MSIKSSHKVNADCKPRLNAPGKLKHDLVRDADFLLLPERVVKLNKTGAAILSLCDGERTITEIREKLKLQFFAENIESDVEGFLNRVVDHGWVKLNCD